MKFISPLILVILALTKVNSESLIFEEDSVSIHSGITIDTTISAIESVSKLIEFMRKIEFENDLLQKIDSPLISYWEWKKNSSLTRLSLRLGSVRTRLNSIFPQKLHRKPINPLDPPTTNNLISPLSKQTNKRAIEFLGNVISYITGVPSPSEWRLNQENIRHLKNAMIKLTKLDNEIGKRISTNSHHLSVINQKLNSLTLSLNYTTNKINLMEQDMRANLIFEALETGTLSTLECLESFLSGIENVIFKGHFNLASVEGISHEFIRDAIVDIQSSFKTLTDF